MIKIRHPYAIIGRHQNADVVIDRSDVAEHHVFLFLDARGLFGVDLRTERGTRFAGSNLEASWLGSGDLIEVGDHTIEIVQLRVNGSVVSGPLSDDDPLGLVMAADPDFRNDLTLRLLNDVNANWSIGSSLVFLGRGAACAVQLTDDLIGTTHSAILRDHLGVYIVGFPGQAVQINNLTPTTASRLTDSDIIKIGSDSLLVQTHETSPKIDSPQFESLVTRLETVVGQEVETDLRFSFQNHTTLHDANPVDYPSLIGRLQAETAALIAVLLRRIEALDEEMARLRERLDADDQAKAQQTEPPIEKLRWDLIPQVDPELMNPSQAGVWLVERLHELETERRTTWTNLLSRIAPTKPAE